MTKKNNINLRESDNKENNTNINIITAKTRLKKNITSKSKEHKRDILETKKNFLKNKFSRLNNENSIEIGNLEKENKKQEKDPYQLLINAKNKNNYKLIGEILEYIKNKNYNPYNPILIRGNNETSKTFILEKIKNILDNQAYFSIARELSLNLSTKEDIKKFLQEINQYDALIIDDLHTIAKESFLQDELCFIIDMLMKKNKTLIISINTEKRHKELSKELANRISMGLVITLPEPDLDIKMQFVQICLEENNLILNKELALFIARKCPSLRKIRSAVINIKIFNNNFGYLPNIHDLEHILKSSGNSIHLDYEFIMSIVGKKYGYNAKDIKSDKREQRLIEARQISMYLARTLLGDTYQKIGKHFGGKDHTTVIYSIRKIEEIIIRNKDMHNTVTELSNMCKV